MHPVLGELGRTWANLGERGSSEDERESSAMAQAGRAMRPRRSPSIVPVSENVMALRAELASTGLLGSRVLGLLDAPLLTTRLYSSSPSSHLLPTRLYSSRPGALLLLLLEYG